jgi:hypothetical protein
LFSSTQETGKSAGKVQLSRLGHSGLWLQIAVGRFTPAIANDVLARLERSGMPPRSPRSMEVSPCATIMPQFYPLRFLSRLESLLLFKLMNSLIRETRLSQALRKMK